MFSSNKLITPTLSLIVTLMFACGNTSVQNNGSSTDAAKLADYRGKTELATFAGGCFWCVEAPFEGIDGVITVISGYAGGKEKNPTYSEVSNGKTSHKESVQITFDPEVISYSELVDIFWQTYDPTDVGGSFYDRGSQYESAIFYHDATQKKVAEESKKLLDKSGKFEKPIATPVIKYTNFYLAEDYHQDYYKKNPQDYYSYRNGSGRDKFIKAHWPELSENKYKSPSKSELKNTLTNLQYKVTMEDATELSFQNEYNGNKKDGIYVDIVSGAPLFSSRDKYESGSGWPSFTKPIDARALEKPTDDDLGMLRVEVRSKFGKSHIGHVFYDGPEPTNLRYCMNSAAMKFIPTEEMEAAGYGDYLWLVN
ncbi:peptide methionine sulfoxide reductase msrA/msrB [Algoriphagus sp. 4150]|uniref:peptide-methionine (S)-S-oxide reductase MsrA n=1 Tax=Algoriphagus sp. 4150 TaxID=2817756 RepID=UPI00285B734D|nr:peptide-methionine (S)-S-oxide reductase MsrA [Algoriphagus sp. 4150]MDR7130444.1 peptide methionine sulfoxide reductase msrA/msrB [Algoriphagus sp. 4150]